MTELARFSHALDRVTAASETDHSRPRLKSSSIKPLVDRFNHHLLDGPPLQAARAGLPSVDEAEVSTLVELYGCCDDLA